ncbi:hypothetical protein [Leclercia adecarboxylata]|uniref:hypothetical protein n=1 Tax=Leclercia adecarboxylata TaxID=83655 RepID=UPI003017F2E3
MTEFTKDQLIVFAENIIATAAKYPTSAPAQADKSLAEIALAALTAPTEPVYQYRIRNGYNGQVTEWQTIRRDQVDFVLKAQTHNAEFQIIAPPAPVVPDGYALVSVEPTMAVLDEFDSIIDHGAEDSKDAWSRLLAAAAQQEINP